MFAGESFVFSPRIFDDFGFTEDEERDGTPEVADVQRLIVGVEQKDFMFGHWVHLVRWGFAGSGTKKPACLTETRVGVTPRRWCIRVSN